MPKVTVLMPVYNGDRYLHESIESIVNQTFVDFEFIIIDDGSSDRSFEIIKSYRDSRVKLFHNSGNLGITKALNIGLQLAQGEYVARMDCDDISLIDRLLIQANFLDINPDITVVGSYMDMIDAEGNDLDYQYKYPLNHHDIVNSMLSSNPMGHPSVMFRHLEVMAMGGYHSKDEWQGVSTEDYDLWLRLAANDYRLANLPQSLIKYRYHQSSLTTKAIADNTMYEGFNQCFYISGSSTFGCSSKDLKHLRTRKHFTSLILFVKIASFLSKKEGESVLQRLKSESFITSMQILTSRKDIISRIAIACLKKNPIKCLAREISSILSEGIELIYQVLKKNEK
jgi:glycosyltransferase involved in cell wall biosynthesis